ncbi:MAG: hypothetical protein UZ08_BCD001001264 [Candidatus Parvibacillus calidus]|jgi:hypothetical protein|nr:MAG: hypothetical protein UZ08_BCD001001264 [Candidatus Parvibacillus calidus]
MYIIDIQLKKFLIVDEKKVNLPNSMCKKRINHFT